MVPAAKILETAKAENCRHHRPVRPDHAVARRDVPCRGRDGAAGLRPAAADRRRDHEPRAHRGEDRSELPARPDRLCHRRQPRGRRRLGADVAATAASNTSTTCAPNMPSIAAAHARAQEDKKRLSLQDARGNALKLDWASYAPPAPTLPRQPRDRRLSRSPSWSTTSTGRRSSDLGAGGKIPGDPRRQDRRRGGALALRRRAGDAEADRRRGLVQGRARCVGFWPANSSGDDIVLFGDESRGKPIATLHTLRQQLARREGRANVALADFVAPTGIAGLHRRLRGHRRHRRGRGRRPLQERQRRLLRDHGQGAGRPPGRSLRRAAAPARAQGVLGLCGRRDA